MIVKDDLYPQDLNTRKRSLDPEDQGTSTRRLAGAVTEAELSPAQRFQQQLVDR